MCGRITQHRSRRQYAAELGLPTEGDQFTRWLGDRNPFYNISPGTWPLVIHMIDSGRVETDVVKWGYRPAWAVEKGFPSQINARVENAMTKPFYRELWRNGRIIVPADGWFEWTGEKGRKQPWYIRLKSDRPMFLAALTDWQPYKVTPPESGFVIVTASSDGGMVDVHDRRPVVLPPEDARRWIDNTLPGEHAEMLARERSRPVDAFEWYRVSAAVNKGKADAPFLIEPAG